MNYYDYQHIADSLKKDIQALEEADTCDKERLDELKRRLRDAQMTMRSF
tara:strand:- start:413 stop:559 length:147 start_codon:yes stop_codon:yes gene_type:complete